MLTADSCSVFGFITLSSATSSCSSQPINDVTTSGLWLWSIARCSTSRLTVSLVLGSMMTERGKSTSHFKYVRAKVGNMGLSIAVGMRRGDDWRVASHQISHLAGYLATHLRSSLPADGLSRPGLSAVSGPRLASSSPWVRSAGQPWPGN